MGRDEILAHVAERLAATRVQREPFPHFYAEGFWPEAFYAELVANLPPDEAYERMPSPYEDRLQINLSRTSAAALSAPVQALEEILHSQAFFDLMTAPFVPEFAAVAEYRQPQIEQFGTPDGLPVGGRTMLARDYAGFAIGPHADSIYKLVVGAFYLPRGPEFEQFGTSIYTHKQGLRAWYSPHMDREDFDLVETFPNRPNSAFVFMKTDNSYHGVERGDYPGGGRDVLFWLPNVGAAGAERRVYLPETVFRP